jgi:hypothetical protein
MLFLHGLPKEEGQRVDAVLLMEPQGAPDKRCVVFIQAGQITSDLVMDKSKAIDQVEQHLQYSQNASLYLQHDEIEHDHRTITWEQIESFSEDKDSGSVLQAVPASPYLLPIVLLLVAGGAGYLAYDEMVIQPEKKRQAQIERAKQDRTPAYNAAAEQALRSRGWDRKDLTAFLSEVGKRRMIISGWSLDSMQCDMTSCISQWGRHGGLVSDLEKNLPEEQLLITGKDANAGGDRISTMEKTVTKRDYERKPAELARADLKPVRQSIITLRPVLQKFVNASINVTAKEPTPWTVSDLGGVKPASVLVEQSLEITAPMFRMPEILKMLPENVLITSFQMNVSEFNINVNLKGAAYASQ